jgi:hypothetical protein
LGRCLSHDRLTAETATTAAAAPAPSSSLLGRRAGVGAGLATATPTEAVEEGERRMTGARQRGAGIGVGGDALPKLDQKLVERALVAAQRRGSLGPRLQLGRPGLGNRAVDAARDLVEDTFDGAGDEAVGGVLSHRRRPGGCRPAPGRTGS